jgi:hypothetical protein
MAHIGPVKSIDFEDGGEVSGEWRRMKGEDIGRRLLRVERAGNL